MDEQILSTLLVLEKYNIPLNCKKEIIKIIKKNENKYESEIKNENECESESKSESECQKN